MGRAALTLLLAAALAAAVFWSPTTVSSLTKESDEREAAGAKPGPTDLWFKIARGGRLYDNWYAEIESPPPEETHPAYPAAGKKKGADTWRCKECHGWDYMGRDGDYGSGAHYTGIKGVRGVRGIDPWRIRDIIMDETHGYTEAILPRSAVEKLALFLSLGQADMDKYIDRRTRTARGSVARGGAFIQTVCGVCHGLDGRARNFGSADDPEYLGTLARKNPWQSLHKIRCGQPGFGMVALTVLDIQYQVDILAYSQTLPTE